MHCKEFSLTYRYVSVTLILSKREKKSESQEETSAENQEKLANKEGDMSINKESTLEIANAAE